MATFGRFTTDPTGDLSRVWSWEPSDLANAVLPSRPLSADELDAAIDALADDDAGAACELREQAVEWTGRNWSIRRDGIPGLELDEDEADGVFAEFDGDSNLSAVSDAAFVVYEGEWAGEEYESTITTQRACRFIPARIVRIIER